MSREDVLHALHGVIARCTATEVELMPHTRFQDDLGLDSLKVMELVAEVEDHFDVNLPLNLLPEIHTVADLARIIETLRETPDA
jgi:acyl carrier protein